VMFFAANTMFRTADGGRSWKEISLDLTRKTYEIPSSVGKYRDQQTAQPAQRGVIEEAPFGAFVPWRPLTTFEVPSLNPGQSTRVHLRVPRTAPAGREPPDPPPTARVRRLLDAISGLVRRWNTGDPTEDADVPCFAGNLNVHIGSESVERHLSGPLRVHAGRLNYAMFFVGEGTDGYRFDLRGEAAYWDAFLCEGITFHSTGGELELGQWYPGTMGHVFLALHPPAEHLVDRLAVADVRHVHVAGRDVGELRAALAQQQLDVVHHLLGLAGRVADRDRRTGVEILRHLAAQVDGAPGDHRLTEVVAEVLLRVGVGGVEGSQADVPAGRDPVAHRVPPGAAAT